MNTRSVLSAAALACAIIIPTLALASPVTLAPTAGNGALPQLADTEGNFVATGATINLGSVTSPSVLTISGNSGAQTFSETGRIFINAWSNSALVNVGNPNGTISNTGLGSDYALYIDFTLTGSGSWGAGPGDFFQYTANPLAGGAFSGTLFAALASEGFVTSYNFGTLSLVPDPTTNAQAILQVAGLANMAPGASGNAQSNFSAVLAFNPAADAEGADGFFRAPSPFNININVGSVGGNVGNTSYTVKADGSVEISTPRVNTSPSTGNLTFTNAVPEPGSLALVSVALLGLGVAANRKRNRSMK